MKIFLTILLWCVVELSSANEQHQPKNGEITPYLSMVAYVDGKALFVDFKTGRNQTEAAAYCSSLGRMQLAEIKSQSQFDAIHEANVEEWPEAWAVWTAGLEIRGIHRYAWSNSGTSIDETLPYRSLDEEYRYGVVFKKQQNSSHLANRPITTPHGTLCETLN